MKTKGLKTKTIVLLAIMTLGAIVFHSQPRHQAIHEPDSSLSIETPVHASTRDFVPEHHQVEETPRPNQQEWRVEFLERMGSALQERLTNDGFDQNEIDITTMEISAEFNKNEDTIQYSEAVYRAAKALNLDDGKKRQLNIAVLKAIGQSVELTFEQWDQCLDYRVKTMSACVQNIAQELSRNIATVSSNQSMTTDEWSRNVDLSKNAMAEAVKQCGVTAEEADRALRVVLSDCP